MIKRGLTERPLRKRIMVAVAAGRAWVRKRVRPGFRWIVGLFLVLLGLLGFLPVLGFWMVPLGLVVMAMDIRPLWRRWRGRPGKP
jgi:hypothetical protein